MPSSEAVEALLIKELTHAAEYRLKKTYQVRFRSRAALQVGPPKNLQDRKTQSNFFTVISEHVDTKTEEVESREAKTRHYIDAISRAFDSLSDKLQKEIGAVPKDILLVYGNMKIMLGNKATPHSLQLAIDAAVPEMVKVRAVEKNQGRRLRGGL